MRRFIAFILYLFYKYYERGKYTKDIAYESALTLLIALIALNLLAIKSYFNIIPNLLPSDLDSRGMRYLEIGLYYVLPSFLILRVLFKKDYIINLKYDERVEAIGNLCLVLYFILSFAAIIIVAFLK